MNKVALVTGSSRGIGSAIIKELASKNYDVIIHYYKNEKSAESLEQYIQKNYNVSCMKIECDLKKEQDIQNMVDKILQNFKKIDILINNAAVEITSELEEKTKDDFIKVLDTNLIGPFLLSKKIGKQMLQNQYGKIINITSNNAINQYDPSTLEYDASKAGIISLTHNLAVAFAPFVTVNAVAPGWVLTDSVKKLNNSLNGMLEQEESKKILINRFTTEEEVAKLVSYLISDDASSINNQVIVIDGGTR